MSYAGKDKLTACIGKEEIKRKSENEKEKEREKEIKRRNKCRI